MSDFEKDEFGMPAIVDHVAFQAELVTLCLREKAHTREGDRVCAGVPGGRQQSAVSVRHSTATDGAFLACGIPARRAAQIDQLGALRRE